ncbi:MAG TPA: tetratricopeptide repeat protein, partial [Dermatophilaceae bacterium]|nr:tetratricopeptide repeat protein [Dermatophilaceae bacterium]
MVRTADAPELTDLLDIDQAWDVLRRHLDWTRGQASAAFLFMERGELVAQLRDRLRLYAAQWRVGFQEVLPTAGGELSGVIRSLMATTGVIWVDLLGHTEDEQRWRRLALHRLNELRTPLTQSLAGCLVVVVPTDAGPLVASAAADLWSTRSLARVVVPQRQAVEVTLTDTATGTDILEVRASPAVGEHARPATFAFTSITVPEGARRPGTVEIVRGLARAAAAAEGGVPGTARQIVRDIAATMGDQAPETVGLVHLATAELAARDGDLAVLAEAGQLAVDVANIAGDAGTRLLLLEGVQNTAIDYARLDLADVAARSALSTVRGVAARSDTLQAARDLSVSLDNLGRVAEARGDWAAAETAYQESLTIARDLADRVDTAQAARDLSVSLNNVGRVAEARGDWTAADTAYQESLHLRRDLADRVDTPQAARDLSVSLDNLGRVAEARGDWAAADTAYQESLTIARDLADRVDTPQAARDLSVSLDNLGRVAQARGDWAAADTAYQESLTIARDLANRVDTPQAARDLSLALNNLGRVAEARGDWTAADTAYQEFLTIARDLADRDDTPQAARDLSLALNNLGRVAEARGDWT